MGGGIATGSVASRAVATALALLKIPSFFANLMTNQDPVWVGLRKLYIRASHPKIGSPDMLMQFSRAASHVAAEQLSEHLTDESGEPLILPDIPDDDDDEIDDLEPDDPNFIPLPPQ